MRLTQTSLILHGKNRYNSRSENRWITPIKSRQLGLYKVVPTRLPLWQELNPLLMLNNQQTPWSDCQAHASVDTLRQTTDAAKQLRCGRALSRVAKKVAGAQEVSAWKLQFPGYDVFRGEH